MEKNEIIGIVPWPVAMATALWFGLMAYKARKNAALWAIGGGMLGLIVTTLVMGLGQAAFIPFTGAEQSAFRVKIGALAMFIVVCVGWLFTASLHPRLLAPWKRAVDTPKEPGPAAPANPSPLVPKS